MEDLLCTPTQDKSDACLSSNARHRKDTQRVAHQPEVVVSHFCIQSRGTCLSHTRTYEHTHIREHPHTLSRARAWGTPTHSLPTQCSFAYPPWPDALPVSILPSPLSFPEEASHHRWPTPPFLPLRSTAGLAWGVGRGSQHISWHEIRVLSVSSQSEREESRLP